jgi:hypothetical protein
MHISYEWYSLDKRLACNDCDRRWYFDAATPELLEYMARSAAQEHALETIPVDFHDPSGFPIREEDW